MISARPDLSFDDLAAALAEMAQVVSEAEMRNRALARNSDPLRWREASLVWPLFTASLMKKG